jgi:hypothetical protein
MGPVTKFSPSGTRLGVVQESESDHLDLAADQCTLYLLNGNRGYTLVKNVCTNLPPEILPINDPTLFDLSALGMRILPDGSLLFAAVGSALVSGNAAVVRVMDGAVTQVYDIPDWSGRNWHGIASIPTDRPFGVRATTMCRESTCPFGSTWRRVPSSQHSRLRGS